MFDFKALVEAHIDELAEMLSSEHGKVIADAKGDIQRGLEVIEFACGIPHALKGEYTEGAGPGIDVYSMRQPLGVVAGITPFNFPAMIPMWMFGVAIACGNAFILKPSERDPSVPVRLAELMMEAGAARRRAQRRPRRQGNGRRDPRPSTTSRRSASSARPTSPTTSTRAARRTGSACRRWAGPRTTASSCPTPTSTRSVNDLAGAAFGSAGERCMALPVVVPVGEKTADALREKLVPAIERLSVGVSTDADAHYGPVVNAAHKQRVEDYIQMGVDEGAELVVDGRGFTLQGYEKGFFIGPTLVRPCEAEHADLPGGDLRPGAADGPRRQLRGGGAPAVRAPVRQRRRHLHPQRPRGARVRRPGQRRHGRRSTCRSRCRSPITPSAAGSARPSATPTSTAWKACASAPRSRPSPSAGPTASPKRRQGRLRHPDHGVKGVMPRLGPFSLLVRDYDEAIDWYTRVLGFRLVIDEDQGHKRWVVVEGDGGGSLVLARAKNDSEQARIGDQHGGRIGFFLEVEAFDDAAPTHAWAGRRIRGRTPPRTVRQGRRVPRPLRQSLGPDRTCLTGRVGRPHCLFGRNVVCGADAMGNLVQCSPPLSPLP